MWRLSCFYKVQNEQCQISDQDDNDDENDDDDDDDDDDYDDKYNDAGYNYPSPSSTNEWKNYTVS